MTEHPILFSSEMVRAILDGRKTQTRRVIKLKHGRPMMANEWASVNSDGHGGWIGWYPHRVTDEQTQELYPNGGGFKCPYGQPGDLLWVREGWAHTPEYCDEGPNCGLPSHIYYRQTEESNGTFNDVKHWGWRPSIHMPRWASRITLQVTGVRVERVQDIGADDAVKEGWRDGCGWERFANGQRFRGDTPVSVIDFAYLWDSINAKRGYSWDSNPWVWVVEFKRL